ncbi:MAG: hypothetical protein ACYC1S_12715 [Gemmatimonadaceae bacterium]|jgi:hypothetical protein
MEDLTHATEGLANFCREEGAKVPLAAFLRWHRSKHPQVLKQLADVVAEWVERRPASEHALVRLASSPHARIRELMLELVALGKDDIESVPEER